MWAFCEFINEIFEIFGDYHQGSNTLDKKTALLNEPLFLVKNALTHDVISVSIYIIPNCLRCAVLDICVRYF